MEGSKNLRWFYICWVIFLIPATIYLLALPKGSFSLYLNQYHHTIADYFFRYITWLGDGITICIICLFLACIKYKYAVVAILNSLIVSTIINIIKSIVRSDRPALYFSSDLELHYVNGVHIFKSYSFPSGHTAAAFCLFYTLCFFTKKPWLQVSFCMLAVLVGISRIYLLQHFLIDAYAGSIIAVAVTHALMLLFSKRTKLLHTARLEGSFFRKIKTS